MNEVLIGLGTIVLIAVIKTALPYFGKLLKFITKNILAFIVKLSINFYVKKAERKYSGEQLGALKKEYVLKKSARFTKYESTICATIDDLIEKAVELLNSKSAVVKDNLTQTIENKVDEVGNKINESLK